MVAAVAADSNSKDRTRKSSTLVASFSDCFENDIERVVAIAVVACAAIEILDVAVDKRRDFDALKSVE